MNLTLFKTTIKNNWVLLLIFFGVLTMYTTIMIAIYDPQDMESIAAMLELFPKDMMKAMGFSTLISNLTTFLASWLYGLLMFAFPMVYCIILGNRLIAKTVDNGSMAYLLSTPISRVKIVITQGIYALVSVAVLFVAIFAVGVLTSTLLYPGLLDVGGYLKINIITMLVNMVVVMITFFFSCLFNDSKHSSGFGSGIPITFLLMNMIGGVSKDTEFLKNLSIYGIYDPVEVVKGLDIMGLSLMFTVIVLLLFIASIIVFKKKRLPI